MRRGRKKEKERKREKEGERSKKNPKHTNCDKSETEI